MYSLLPSALRQRPAKGAALPGVQAVGRLDQDTTGALLLSDDGQFIHRLSSPRHHVPKLYEVTLKHAVNSQQVQRLLAGVVLDDDLRPVRAAACEATGEYALRLTLPEGTYHQVKRMVAAVGNRGAGATPLVHRRTGAAQGSGAGPVVLARAAGAGAGGFCRCVGQSVRNWAGALATLAGSR